MTQFAFLEVIILIFVGWMFRSAGKHGYYSIPSSYLQHRLKTFWYNRALKWGLTRKEKQRLSYDVSGDEKNFDYEKRVRELIGKRIPPSGQIN